MYEERERRRRRRRDDRKPVSTEAITAVILAGVSILIFAVFLEAAAESSGNTAAIYGGLGVFAMILSIVSLTVGVRAYRNENFSRAPRVAGVVVSAVATFVWVGLYLTGMFLG